MNEIEFEKVHEMEEMLHDCKDKEEAMKTLTLFFFAVWMRKDSHNDMAVEIINLYEYTKDLAEFLKKKGSELHDNE